jgi:hypothetical protein
MGLQFDRTLRPGYQQSCFVFGESRPGDVLLLLRFVVFLSGQVPVLYLNLGHDRFLSYIFWCFISYPAI